MGRLGNAFRRGWKFMVQDIWDLDPGSLAKIPALGVKTLRVIHLVVRGFWEDECPLQASALTFGTLMAIVPVLALSFSLASGLGGGDVVKERVRGTVSDWTRGFLSNSTVTNGLREIVTPSRIPGEADHSAALADEINTLVDQAFQKVDKINFRAIGGVGLAVLVVIVIGMLAQVEWSFNKVWGVKSPRSPWRQFTDYVSVLVVLPILVIAGSSLPVLDRMLRFFSDAGGPLPGVLGVSAVKQTVSMIMTWISFTFIIWFMPNTKVKVGPALAGGAVAAILFVGWLWLCAAIQVGVAGYSRIYGSFAVVPILLAWVHVSWQVVLFGAEIAFGIQNCGTYVMESSAHRASTQSRIILALSVVTEAARSMRQAETSFSPARFAADRRISVRLLNEVMKDMVQSKLMARVDGPDENYVLLRSPESLSLREVIDTIMAAGVVPQALGLANVDPMILDIARKADKGVYGAIGTMTVRDLLPPPSVAPADPGKA